MHIKWIAAAGLIAALVGCQPESPPDLVKTQRDALNKAKAVNGQVQQQADEQRKAVDEAQK